MKERRKNTQNKFQNKIIIRIELIRLPQSGAPLAVRLIRIYNKSVMEWFCLDCTEWHE